MKKKTAHKLGDKEVYEVGQVYMRKSGNRQIPMRYLEGGKWLKQNPKGSNGDVKRGMGHKLPELDFLVSDIMGEEKIVDGVPRSAAYLILAAIRKKAVAGDVRAAELLLDRGYGKAKQEINVNKRVLQVIKIAGKEIEF